jgi:hypothetical protein
VVNDLSRLSRIRKLVALERSAMGRPASQRVARIVYSQGQRRETPIAHAVQASRNDCLQRNVTTPTAPTTYHARNGDVVVKNPCVSVVLQVYLYV